MADTLLAPTYPSPAGFPHTHVNVDGWLPTPPPEWRHETVAVTDPDLAAFLTARVGEVFDGG
jgi:hypothetical protein